MDIIQTAMHLNLTLFITALNRTNISSQLLTNTGSFTVFIPTNAAMLKMSPGGFDHLFQSENIGLLERIISHHIYDGRLTTKMMNAILELTMMGGENVTVVRQDESMKWKVNDADLIGIDALASNSLIHVIDGVLLPRLIYLEPLIIMGQFRIIIDIIRLPAIGSYFNEGGLSTLFAPVDAAFSRFTPEVMQRLFIPKYRRVVEDLFKHHVINANLSSDFFKNLIQDKYITMASLQRVEINKKIGSTLKINNATVVTSEILVDTIIMYGIDDILVPHMNVFGNFVLSPIFNKFHDFQIDEIVSHLSMVDAGAKHFLPIDAAFDKLPVGVFNDLLRESSTSVRSRILSYHSTPGGVIVNTTVLTNSMNDKWLITKNGSNWKINNANIAMDQSLSCTNGDIYPIDEFLIPPLNIFGILLFGKHSRIIWNALESTYLAEVLQSNTKVTFFAPVDAAFDKLSNHTRMNLLKRDNKQKRINILKYHLLIGSFLLRDINKMVFPVQLTTTSGHILTLSKSDESFLINNNVKILQEDIATNGVILWIDTLLITDEPSRSIVRICVSRHWCFLLSLISFISLQIATL